MKKVLFTSVIFFCLSSHSQQNIDLKLNLFFDVNKYDLTKQHLMLIDFAISDLLIERGIPFQSMTFKGVGNSQMVFNNPKNDEEKRKNMRVEILISCKK